MYPRVLSGHSGPGLCEATLALTFAKRGPENSPVSSDGTINVQEILQYLLLAKVADVPC